jgi:MFS family permease
MAVPYQIYQLTHEPFAVGLLGIVEVVPMLALSLLGGAIADARDRRTMVLLTEIAFLVLSAILLVNALSAEPNLPIMYIVAAAHAGLFALQRPSLEALWPRLVTRDELTAAGALSMLRGTFGRLLGPAIGGVLIATVGLPTTYGIDIISFAGSLVALAMMGRVPPVDPERPSFGRVIEGLRFARSRPELIGTYTVDLVAMFFGMPSALFPAIADAMGGPALLGLLYSAPDTGAFLAMATSGWTKHVHRHGLAVILAATTWGVAIAGFGLASFPPVALALLAVAGSADAISGIFRASIWNRTVPDALRGRMASIEMVSYATGPALGNAESGLVASLFSVRTSIVSGGVLCVVGVGLCALLVPAFRAYDIRAAEPARVPRTVTVPPSA